MNTNTKQPGQLMTSLSEISAFNPCTSGWRRIAGAMAHKYGMFAEFPLIDCLDSCTFADVCWLLGKRKTEIQIAVIAARKCAESVRHLARRADAAADAADAAAYADAADAAAYATDAAADAAAAAYAAVDAADAADADAAAYAAAAADADAAADVQHTKNKQFLREAILEWEANHANTI